MKRYQLLRLVLAGIASTFLTNQISADSGSGGGSDVLWNHDPSSAIGPKHWGELKDSSGKYPFVTCGRGTGAGTKQSPVDLRKTTKNNNLPKLIYDYKPKVFKILNTGHYIEVPFEENSGGTGTVTIGEVKYTLSQLHFHAPSEHALNTKHWSAELHMVHESSAGAVVVISIPLMNADSGYETIKKISNKAPAEASSPPTILDGLYSVASMFPSNNAKKYYTYSGSLTTPPCTEPATFYVLKDAVAVDKNAIDHFRKIISKFPNYNNYDKNNRPVQDLNLRTIGERE